ncbi:transmembrane protein 26 [Aplysia californica]|uniref:Transmembrane protein 26 n=1 Tax=Aplysia californica TaxID=6500 RepID=A0ABM0ZUX0_APLCA|nr:transmembrane protein 26 [Aplysia californica]XP_012934954.1 transmembrane protein 26 [Aplysia californica]XP_012934955.1 transmembrane protein 26 [Aplysia californica]
MIVIKVFKAIIVRATLALHSILAIWRVTVMREDTLWWLLACTLVPFAIEAAYTIIKRHGDEFKWFTPCFVFYLGATVPCVWLLELDKTDRYQEGTVDQLDKMDNNTSSGLSVGISLNPNMWTILIEELLLYILIVSRWVLPRGEVTREQLSELLFAFIGIASDIMEMFSLFGESVVRNNKYMAYWILVVWSVSVLQFTMTVTVTHQPKKAKNIKVIVDQDEALESAKIRNEIFAIVVSMLMQDVPFVTLRLYTIVTYNLVTYSLVFFTAKNILVISLLIYKIAVLLQKRYCPELGDDDEEELVIGSSDDEKKRKGRKGTKDEEGIILASDKGGKKLVEGYGTLASINNERSPNSSELKRRNGKGPNNDTASSNRDKGNENANMVQPAVAINDSALGPNPSGQQPPIQPYSFPNQNPNLSPSSSRTPSEGHGSTKSNGSAPTHSRTSSNAANPSLDSGRPKTPASKQNSPAVSNNGSGPPSEAGDQKDVSPSASSGRSPSNRSAASNAAPSNSAAPSGDNSASPAETKPDPEPFVSVVNVSK